MVMQRLQHLLKQQSEGLQRAPGYLEKPDLQGGRQPVLIPITRENGRTRFG
jgi:hypothetical protein